MWSVATVAALAIGVSSVPVFAADVGHQRLARHCRPQRDAVADADHTDAVHRLGRIRTDDEHVVGLARNRAVMTMGTETLTRRLVPVAALAVVGALFMNKPAAADRGVSIDVGR